MQALCSNSTAHWLLKERIMFKTLKILPTLLLVLLAAHSNANTVVVLGDSLSAAYGMDEDQGWVYLLEKELGEEHQVINASIGGNTTADGLARLPKLLNTYHPDTVVVALGGNDGLRGYATPTIRANLVSILNAVKHSAAQPLLIGIQIPPSYGQRYAQQFANVYTDVAKTEKVPLLPFLLEGVALTPEWMQPDGIHPNADAQPAILQNVLPVLSPLLSLNQAATPGVE